MSIVNLIPFERSYLEKYQSFARKYYGKSAYQAKTNYIDWLYHENPLSSNYKDFTIAVTETDQVVGCIHKMRLAWNYDEHETAVPAVHNLVVDENYRRVTGLRLVQASVAGEQHVFMPGTVSKPLIELFQILKYQKINVLWYRKILRPINGALTYTARKYLNYPKADYYFDPSRLSKFISAKYSVTMLPDNQLLEQLAFLMNSQDEKICSPMWDKEQLRWRFFHPFGPKTCVDL
jgi:hypothetical protein